jgi:hypothetical protein
VIEGIVKALQLIAVTALHRERARGIAGLVILHSTNCSAINSDVLGHWCTKQCRVA